MNEKIKNECITSCIVGWVYAWRDGTPRNKGRLKVLLYKWKGMSINMHDNQMFNNVRKKGQHWHWFYDLEINFCKEEKNYSNYSYLYQLFILVSNYHSRKKWLYASLKICPVGIPL